MLFKKKRRWIVSLSQNIVSFTQKVQRELINIERKEKLTIAAFLESGYPWYPQIIDGHSYRR